MKRTVKYLSCLFLALSLSMAFNGCKKKESNPQPASEANYSAMLMVGAWPNTAYYIAEFSSLTSGEISLKGNGAELTGKVYAQDVIYKNGYYYHANATNGRLGKYHVENGKIVTDKEVPLADLNWASYVWPNDETLVFFGTNADGNEVRYAVVNVSGLQVTTGKLAVNATPEGFPSYTVGFAEYRNDKIYLGYGFTENTWPIVNLHKKSLVAAISFPGMQVVASSEDTHSNGSGNSNVYCPYSFKDENNDVYFITDPYCSSYDADAPSLVYRIKNGSDKIDAGYSFDYSSASGNDRTAAIWYLANGKAIVRSRGAGPSIDTDHSYTIINIHTGTFIKKLDLPADKGERMVQAVVVENGKAYIAVNASDRDYIWEYDPATDALKKGAEFVGGLDYILRLEKLK